MAHDTYLEWVIRETATQWWHDSAEAAELRAQIEALKARLSKIEARQRRKEGAAA